VPLDERMAYLGAKLGSIGDIDWTLTA
jgi:hypothetical protein